MFTDLNWMTQLAESIRDAEALAERLHLDPETRAALDRLAGSDTLPFRVTPYWLSLAGAGAGPGDPILAQCLPSPREFEPDPDALPDPLGESRHRAAPSLVRQYRSRALLRASGECAVHCRHCFRRTLLPSERGFISPEDQSAVAAWLAERPEIREILVSGGDPLVASDGRVESLLSSLRAARPEATLRVCTRCPSTLPMRFTPGLVGLLRAFRPLRVVTHFNHPRELSPQADEALGNLIDAGIPVFVQTVLLRGINDDPDVLEGLFSGLVRRGAQPYYLFQGDLAPGTAHLRCSLSRGLAIYAELRSRLSGLELPRYAVDAPGGGGKAFLPEDIEGREGDRFILRTPSGGRAYYPADGPGDTKPVNPSARLDSTVGCNPLDSEYTERG